MYPAVRINEEKRPIDRIPCNRCGVPSYHHLLNWSVSYLYADGTPDNVTRYEYNDRGAITLQEHRETNPKRILSTISFQFDESGRLDTRSEDGDGDGLIERVTTFWTYN